MSSEFREKQKKHIKKVTFGLYHVYCVLMVIIGLAVAPNTTILDKLCILGICLVLAPPLNFALDKIWALGRKIQQKLDEKHLRTKSITSS